MLGGQLKSFLYPFSHSKARLMRASDLLLHDNSANMVLEYVGSCLGSIFILLICAIPATATANNPPLYDEQPVCERQRDLLKTIWSCIATILALGADYYGVFASRLNAHIFDSFADFFSTIIYVFSVPLLHPSNLVRKAVQARFIVFRRLQQNGVDITREACKVVISSSVFVDVPTAVNVHGDFDDAHPFGKLKKLSRDKRLNEAVEWPCVEWNKAGANNEDRHLIGIELNLAGKEWLLQSGILPPPEQLRFFQTKNWMSITLAALQASGFLLVTGERLTQGLKVSPLEALATPMAVVVLLQAGLHRWSAGSINRIILIHLRDDQLPQWEHGLSEHDSFDYKDFEKPLRIVISVVFICGLVIGPTVLIGLYFYKVRTEHGLDVSALTFQIAMAAYIAMIATTQERETKWTRKSSWARIFACITLSLLSISFAFAVIYTVRNWELFSPDAKPITQFIIPHV